MMYGDCADTCEKRLSGYASAQTREMACWRLDLWQWSLMDSDTQIFRDIVAEFQACPILHYAQLQLHVQDGIATIFGRVNSLAHRKAAERAARRVTGIKTLVIEIRAAAVPIVITGSARGLFGQEAADSY